MDDYDYQLQRRLDMAMPWVGLYVAVASAVCTLAMAADVVHGLRRKMLWFPCEYFSLNAASLTVLTVAMKLPTDLNTEMINSADWIARHVSLLFMITAMSNFMPSLGCKSDGAILANVIALGILVITILANNWIQTIQLADYLQRQDINADIAITVLMLLSLATIISSAITTPVSKRNLESKYQVMHGVASRGQAAVMQRDGIRIGKRTVDEMKKYWIVVQTGNPQFVAACSIFCITSGLVCLLSTIMLLIIYIKWYLREHRVTLGRTETVYGRYTQWILVIQTIGAAVGMIAPIFRWFVAVRFKRSETIDKINFKKEFRIEAHWIQTLVHWRDSFSVLQSNNLCCKEYLYDVKWFILTFCIGFQVLVVLLSKVFLIGSAFLFRPCFLFFDLLEKSQSKHFAAHSSLVADSLSDEPHQGLESDALNLDNYVLLLEGEAMLPKITLMNICKKADELIQEGKTQRPQNLICLLTKIRNFNGVGEFDSRRVPSLHSQEPPNCWTLPLMTLTSIAVALPNVSDHRITQLVSCLNEVISLVKLVDKTSNPNAPLKNIRRAANMCWGRVVLYRKWQGFDLRKVSTKYKNSKQILQELSGIAEKTVMKFNRNDNVLTWPVNVILANSMYRISQTILLSYQDQEDELTDEELFDQLSTRITGILAACLTNLASVIITLCRCNAIGKREKSVRKAFLLLGKTEEMLELLHQYEWPSMGHGKAASIEEWYTLVHSDSHADEVSTAVFNGEQISIEIH